MPTSDQSQCGVLISGFSQLIDREREVFSCTRKSFHQVLTIQLQQCYLDCMFLHFDPFARRCFQTKPNSVAQVSVSRSDSQVRFLPQAILTHQRKNGRKKARVSTNARAHSCRTCFNVSCQTKYLLANELGSCSLRQGGEMFSLNVSAPLKRV